uniref:Uncharacterized protein n=1 Tax=Arundo donax TaxID=35708 RepID=A0A0A8YIX4_ARUDO
MYSDDLVVILRCHQVHPNVMTLVSYRNPRATYPKSSKMPYATIYHWKHIIWMLGGCENGMYWSIRRNLHDIGGHAM